MDDEARARLSTDAMGSDVGWGLMREHAVLNSAACFLLNVAKLKIKQL